MTMKPEALLLEIAAKHFHLETLETRNSDSLDFHDVAVWSIRAALEAAFASGQATARLRHRDTLIALIVAARKIIANPPATTSPHKPPFDKPRNHDEEIANVKAWRDWHKAQKGITE